MTIDIVVSSRDWHIKPASELEEIAQNVAMIISTLKGSCPLDRTFGIDPAKVDDPINVAQAKLSAEIAAAVREQEPRARIKKIFYGGETVDGELKITARVEVVEKNLRGGLI